MADPLPRPVLTREELQSFFVNIHNLLWNNIGLNPDKALEHMMFFVAFIIIEPHVDALRLPPVCRWSATAALTGDPEGLYAAVMEAIQAFNEHPTTSSFFMEKLEIEHSHKLVDVVRVMRTLTRESIPDTDVIGDMVEYMQSRGSSIMSEEGQYFTPRKVCRLAFKLALEAHPAVRRADGSLCTFADFFSGTGGFATEFVRGVRRVDPAIDWVRERRAVYAVDKNKSSVSATLLNLLAVTGTPFTTASVQSRNSFADQLVRGPAPAFPGLSLDFNLTNPPYGGDKSTSKEYRFKYADTNADIKSVDVKADDKVSAGVQLSMALLSEDGGVAAMVLPQGFFFAASKASVALRQKLCEEYCVRVVADIAPGAFANTGTKTSLLVFQRGVGPTTTVRFINADDESALGEATLEQLRQSDYSLSHARYVAQAEPELDGYEWVRLGDVVTLKRGTFNSGSMDGNGAVPFYSCKASNPCGRHSEPTLDHESYVLFASGGGSSKNKDGNNVGMGKSYLVSGKSAYTPDVVALIPGERIDAAYLWGFLRTRRSYICQLANFTTGLGHISPNTLRSIKVPMPSIERQRVFGESIEAWASLKDHYEGSLRILEKALAIDVKEAGRRQPATRLGDVMTTNPLRSTKTLDAYTYIDIGSVSVGRITINDPIPRGDLPGRATYAVVPGDVLLSNVRPNLKSFAFIHDSLPCASLIVSNGFTVLRSSSPRLLPKCLYALVSSDAFTNALSALATGTTYPAITSDTIKNMMLRLPTMEHQRSLQPLFDEVQNLQAKIAYFTAKMEAAIAAGIPHIAPAPVVQDDSDDDADEPERPGTPPPAAQEPVVATARARLEDMALPALKDAARERKLKGWSKLGKKELVTFIRSQPGPASD